MNPPPNLHKPFNIIILNGSCFIKTSMTANLRRKTNLLYQYEVDNVSLIFRYLYYYLVLKVNAMCSLLRRKKKKKEKPNNTRFYVVPYPADTVLLESQ